MTPIKKDIEKAVKKQWIKPINCPTKNHTFTTRFVDPVYVCSDCSLSFVNWHWEYVS